MSINYPKIYNADRIGCNVYVCDYNYLEGVLKELESYSMEVVQISQSAPSIISSNRVIIVVKQT